MDIKPLNKNKTSLAPKLIFREEAYFDLKKMMSSTLARDTEFMCFGTVEKVTERKEYIIDHFYLIPNKENSGAYCEADEERLNSEFYPRFAIPDRRRIRCHCHSHVNMNTSPSGTDAEQGESFAASVSDYFIQLIINHKDMNTANILQSSTGIGFYKVPMYIQIGNHVAKLKEQEKDEIKFFSWSEEKGIDGSTVNIPNGKYEISDGWLNIDDSLFMYMDDQSWYLVGDHMQIDSVSISLHKDAITEDMKKEINEEFTKMVRKKEYKTPSAYQPSKYRSPANSCYWDNENPRDLDYYHGGYSGRSYGGYEYSSELDSEYINGMKTDTKKSESKKKEEKSSDISESELYADFKDFLTPEEAKTKYMEFKKKYPKFSDQQILDLMWSDVWFDHRHDQKISVTRDDLGTKKG